MLKIHELFLRTFISIFLGILITFSIVTYFWSKNIYLDQIEKNLVQNIDTFSVVLKDLSNIDYLIKDLKAHIKHRITLIDEKGNIIAESDKDKESMENHANRKEILEAKEFGFGKSIRSSITVGKELMYVAKKITVNKNIYFIRMADYTDKLTDQFYKLTFQIFAFISFFLIIAFVVTYYMSLRIKNETDNILTFLTQLSTRKPSFALRSTFTYEFYKITKLLNKVAVKLAKKEKQKSKQTAKLKLSNRQKDEIISAISHEFKNPIAVISGYTETILNDKDMPLNIKNKFLTKIYSNANKMSAIIDKLRLTLKLEEGKQELILTPCPIKTLIENAANDLKDKYRDREINILGEDITLKVDETLISMAITNLIENALKYSEDNVDVEISNESICIIDRGIGIEPIELEKINQKFYRVSKNGWNNSLGLGLFIVQSVLSLHNFRLEISSDFGSGSKFCIKY